MALCSSYAQLEATLEGIPVDVFMGVIRYGDHPVERWNTIDLIMRKRDEFADENELRAFLCYHDRAGHNRHFDVNNRVHNRPQTPPPANIPEGEKMPVNLVRLVNELVVGPKATEEFRRYVLETVRARVG